MPITSSQLISDNRQIDGRRHVTERHLDQLGEEYLVSYLCDAAFDATAAMLSRVVPLYSDKVQAEIAENVRSIMEQGSLAIVVLKHSTAAENAAALRVAYKSATRTEAVYIADYLATLTDAVLRNLFSLTQTQVNALRTNKLTPAVALATSIRTSSGA